MIKKYFFIVLSIILLIFIIVSTHRVKILEQRITNLESALGITKDSISLVSQNTLCYITPLIRNYNKQSSFTSIKQIARVMHHYGMDKTKEMMKMYVGQLLIESGGSQRYINGHPKQGNIIVSNGGAIGISQITSSTALNYLDRIVTDNDKIDMLKLGSSEFNFINSTNLSFKLESTREWLKIEKNNIILWGYIISKLYKRNNNVIKTLLCYNMGIGGLKTYMDSGNVINDHQYIVSIKSKVFPK